MHSKERYTACLKRPYADLLSAFVSEVLLLWFGLVHLVLLSNSFDPRVFKTLDLSLTSIFLVLAIVAECAAGKYALFSRNMNFPAGLVL